MIELKTNPDYLDQLAADHILDGRDATGGDLKAAALDHKNLQEYAERLERNVSEMSAELQSYKTANDELAANFFDLMRDRIDRQILRHITDHVEKSEADGDAIREAIKDMVRDGDLCVDVDYSNVELELSISC
jgi:uncharacterized protein (UPF0335 family)